MTSFDSPVDSTRYTTLPSLDTTFPSFDNSLQTPISSFSEESPAVYPSGTFDSSFSPHLSNSHMGALSYSASDLYPHHSHQHSLRSAVPHLSQTSASTNFGPIDPLACHDPRMPDHWNNINISADPRQWDRYKASTPGGPSVRLGISSVARQLLIRPVIAVLLISFSFHSHLLYQNAKYISIDRLRFF